MFDPFDCEVAKVNMVDNRHTLNCMPDETWLLHKRLDNFNLMSLKFMKTHRYVLEEDIYIHQLNGFVVKGN